MKTVPLALFAFAASASFATDYYVHNLLGYDANDGLTPSTALRTIEKGLGECQPGGGQDRLFILPSPEPYRGSMLIHEKSYAPEAPLVIDGGRNWLIGSRPEPPGNWTAAAGYRDTYYKSGVRDNHGKSDDFFFVIFNGLPQMMGRSRLTQDIPTPDIGDLSPDEWTIRNDRLYVRLKPGYSINDYQIEIVETKIGVDVEGRQNSVTINNIKTKFFWADGFGIHGHGRHIAINNVEASFNWNQGISSHGSAQYVLRDAVMLGNMEGLVNVHTSRSEHHYLLQGDSPKWEFKFRDAGSHRFFDSFIHASKARQFYLGESGVSVSFSNCVLWIPSLNVEDTVFQNDANLHFEDCSVINDGAKPLNVSLPRAEGPRRGRPPEPRAAPARPRKIRGPARPPALRTSASSSRARTGSCCRRHCGRGA